MGEIEPALDAKAGAIAAIVCVIVLILTAAMFEEVSDVESDNQSSAIWENMGIRRRVRVDCDSMPRVAIQECS